LADAAQDIDGVRTTKSVLSIFLKVELSSPTKDNFAQLRNLSRGKTHNERPVELQITEQQLSIFVYAM
jgi:hypothetical protein